MEVSVVRKWFSLNQTAKLVGLNPCVLRRAIMDGSLKAYKKPATYSEPKNTHLILNMDDVDEWLRSQEPGKEALNRA